MEYISYILITLGILIICLLLMRPPALPAKKERWVELAPRAVRQANEDNEAAELDGNLRSTLLQNTQMHVPTPWGWPGHHGPSRSRHQVPPNSQEVHGISESLHHLVDRLFTEKHTVDSQEYLLRKDASLRALVEDRFGRTSTMNAGSYIPARPPRLGKPLQTDDQMNNFPSGKVDKIAARIPRQPGLSNVAERHAPLKKTFALQDVRKPWGW